MSKIPTVYLCIFSTIIAIIIIAIIAPVIFIFIWTAYKRDKKFAKKSNMSIAEFLSSRQTRSKPVIPDELKEGRIKTNLEYSERISESAQIYFAKTKPIMQASVNKIGHSDAYHHYSEPDIKDPESYIVAVRHEVQYHEENFDNKREVYVVNIDGADIGELSKATIERIEREIGFYDATFNVATIRVDGDKMQIRLNVFDTRISGILNHT
jgi:hypothetical protein